MRNEIRTFVAINIQLQSEILHQLKRFKFIFKNDRINWIDEENVHLTLRFIGNTSREQLYQLVDRLEVVANQCSPFHIIFSGIGYFSNRNKPRVLFANIQDSIELGTLVKKVERNVVASGFHEELKPYRPHVTLGRIKHLENRIHFYEVINEIKDNDYQSSNVSEFILYQSILTPNGPIYKPIKSFKLQ